MALASLILGLLSLIFMMGGLFTTMVPFVGSLLSFGAPILGLFGLILGGVATSRASTDGDTSGLGIAGMVLSGIGFLIGVLFALTCGMCNVCATQAAMSSNDQTSNNWPAWNQGQGFQGNQGFGQNNQGNQGVTPPPAMDPCVLAESCCLAFSDQDAQFCAEPLRVARESSDPEGSCLELVSQYERGFGQLGQPVPDACRPSAAPAAGGVCNDSCGFAHDNECDDGRPGSDTDLCDPGTDCSDCGP